MPFHSMPFHTTYEGTTNGSFLSLHWGRRQRRFLKQLENYRTSLRQMDTDVRKVAKSAGKGAAERLKAGYCLTSLSEATRKLVGKPPKALQSV